MKEFILIALGASIGYLVKSKIEENKKLKDELSNLKARMENK